MLQVSVIGRLGSDAEKRNVDGREFISFNVAHTESFTSADGVSHESVVWVSCALNGDGGRLLPWLVAGQMVFVQGSASLRVYSSQKERCMKAGLSLSVRSVELVGGQPDLVPRTLYDADGIAHTINKAYYVSQEEAKNWHELVSQKGTQFVVDERGFVLPKQ